MHKHAYTHTLIRPTTPYAHTHSQLALFCTILRSHYYTRIHTNTSEIKQQPKMTTQHIVYKTVSTLLIYLTITLPAKVLAP